MFTVLCHVLLSDFKEALLRFPCSKNSFSLGITLLFLPVVMEAFFHAFVLKSFQKPMKRHVITG